MTTDYSCEPDYDEYDDWALMNEDAEYGDPRVNPCPECDFGEVIYNNLAPFVNPGATQAECSADCGWSS